MPLIRQERLSGYNLTVEYVGEPQAETTDLVLTFYDGPDIEVAPHVVVVDLPAAARPTLTKLILGMVTEAAGDEPPAQEDLEATIDEAQARDPDPVTATPKRCPKCGSLDGSGCINTQLLAADDVDPDALDAMRESGCQRALAYTGG